MFKEIKSKRIKQRKYYHSQPKSKPNKKSICHCFVLEKVKVTGNIYKCTNQLCNQLFTVKYK